MPIRHHRVQSAPEAQQQLPIGDGLSVTFGVCVNQSKYKLWSVVSRKYFGESLQMPAYECIVSQRFQLQCQTRKSHIDEVTTLDASVGYLGVRASRPGRLS